MQHNISEYVIHFKKFYFISEQGLQQLYSGLKISSRSPSSEGLVSFQSLGKTGYKCLLKQFNNSIPYEWQRVVKQNQDMGTL